MDKYIVEHCNSKKEFDTKEKALKHAEALTKLGYDSAVYLKHPGLYKDIYILVYKSINEEGCYGAFYNFKLRG